VFARRKKSPLRSAERRKERQRGKLTLEGQGLWKCETKFLQVHFWHFISKILLQINLNLKYLKIPAFSGQSNEIVLINK
jgi:hypothetical protein